MKRFFTLIIVCLLITMNGFSQNSDKVVNIPEVKRVPSQRIKKVEPELLKLQNKQSKALGDTIYYQDFNGGLPSGWSIVNNSNNNFNWTWDTVYQAGQFSSSTNVINSTTASNGFMSLPSDLYNTPFPMTTGPILMDTYFETTSIDLTNGGLNPIGYGSVEVSFQQTARTCCGPTRQVIQVSTDSFATFTEYFAVFSRNTFGTIHQKINISSVASNASHIKIRFLSDGNSNYYWMIDDFAVVEGAENDLELRDPYLEFNPDYIYNPFYTQIPFNLFSPLRFSGNLYNAGSNNLTGVQLKADILHISDPTGAAPLGLIYNESSSPVSLVSSLINDTVEYSVTNYPAFCPAVIGLFSANLLADSDSLDQVPSNNTFSQSFFIHDTIYAKDDNSYGGGTGPGSYVRAGQSGGQAVGDAFGTMYIIESTTGNGPDKIPTSVTFAVSNDPANIGVEIVPTIWKYEEDSLFAPASGSINAAFSGGVVASSFIPYTIQSNDTSTLLTLPLDNATALDSGQYIVGWTVTNTNGGNSFEVYEDASSVLLQKKVTTFINFGHSPGWGWVNANPVIRLNFGSISTNGTCRSTSGLSKDYNETNEIYISPNPNNGLFNLILTSHLETTFNLSIRNMLGQEVLTDVISVNGSTTEQMDLTQFDKGVYFVSLENGAEKVVKKVVVE